VEGREVPALSSHAMRSRSQERLAICAGCPFLFTPTMTCKRCGCFLRIKTLIPNQTCPEGKW